MVTLFLRVVRTVVREEIGLLGGLVLVCARLGYGVVVDVVVLFFLLSDSSTTHGLVALGGFRVALAVVDDLDHGLIVVVVLGL